MSTIKGYVQFRRVTPKIAARAARQRVRKIELLLQEIADLYGDVYQPVVTSCDIVTGELEHIRETVADALEAGAEL